MEREAEDPTGHFITELPLMEFEPSKSGESVSEDDLFIGGQFVVFPLDSPVVTVFIIASELPHTGLQR